MTVPHVTPPSYPVRKPGRFSATIRTDDPSGCRVGLLGLPDDTGIKMNGGRPGAAEGPAAFREALATLGVAHPAGFEWPLVYDAGDVVAAATLEETHERVTSASKALVDLGLIPIGVGGGHDLTYAFTRGIIPSLENPVVVYCDAHLDVRETPGSGMPFRWLADHCGVKEFHVHGLDPYANASEHLNWFQSHGGRVDPFGPHDDWPAGDVCFSFDLDVLDQQTAPGVSAPNPTGWSSAQAERWCHAAGRCERVHCLDIMELSPPHDRDDRTARLAARLFQAMLRGVAERRS
ncbi:MAG: formimidoylglutamase [Planctomycetota bacterium]